LFIFRGVAIPSPSTPLDRFLRSFFGRSLLLLASSLITVGLRVLLAAAPSPLARLLVGGRSFGLLRGRHRVGASVPSLRAFAVLRSLLRVHGAGALTRAARARVALFSSKS